MYGVTVIPEDDSAFFIESFPLPEDHWLYASKSEDPPMLLQCGTEDPKREALEKAIRAGVRYALRASTRNGQDNDYDPDAVVNNAIIGIIGYFTPDGTNTTSNARHIENGESNE